MFCLCLFLVFNYMIFELDLCENIIWIVINLLDIKLLCVKSLILYVFV